jgi:hypothetical protein
MPGKRRVSARQGWAGEKDDCFSIPLGEGEGNRRKGNDKYGKCNPSDNNPLSAQRYVNIVDRRMSETP